MEKKKSSLTSMLGMMFAMVFALVLSPLSSATANPVVKITLLQLNDVYEISPVSGGKEGGLARVATLRKELLKKNPNTFTILAGDLLSPSALGTAKVDEVPLYGEQIVAVMNELGLDFATLGNHEFDIDEESFLKRIQESKFVWFSSNVFDKYEKPFPGVSDTVTIKVKNGAGPEVSIGLLGVILADYPVKYAKFSDPMKTAKTKAKELRGKVDILVGVTHLAMRQDIQLAVEAPELDLILGGHEHENIQAWRGADYTPIFKADANARTVYVHDLEYNTDFKKLKINSRLQFITDKITEDPETAALVKFWEDKAFAAFEADGFKPREIVTKTTDPLDGKEASVRNFPTKLTELIADGMFNATANADLSLYNAGSVRIDDILPPGVITEYDVIRVLPFGGKIITVLMKGSLLQEVLDQGVENKGTGGYLQKAKVKKTGSGWEVNGKALVQDRDYVMGITDFLLTGKETGLGSLKCVDESGNAYLVNCPDKRLKIIKLNEDIRKALISELQKTYGR